MFGHQLRLRRACHRGQIEDLGLVGGRERQVTAFAGRRAAVHCSPLGARSKVGGGMDPPHRELTAAPGLTARSRNARALRECAPTLQSRGASLTRARAQKVVGISAPLHCMAQIPSLAVLIPELRKRIFFTSSVPDRLK